MRHKTLLLGSARFVKISHVALTASTGLRLRTHIFGVRLHAVDAPVELVPLVALRIRFSYSIPRQHAAAVRSVALPVLQPRQLNMAGCKLFLASLIALGVLRSHGCEKVRTLAP